MIYKDNNYADTMLSRTVVVSINSAITGLRLIMSFNMMSGHGS